nr:MAG TPA: hypothetical protein [Microviridae sp.]
MLFKINKKENFSVAKVILYTICCHYHTIELRAARMVLSGLYEVWP